MSQSPQSMFPPHLDYGARCALLNGKIALRSADKSLKVNISASPVMSSPTTMTFSNKNIRQRPAVTKRMSCSLLLVLIAAASNSAVAAAQCVPLRGSKQCNAFQDASVSTDSFLTGLYPFLKYVSSTEAFDEQLATYIRTSYVQQKYQTLLGCKNVDLTNTTNLYARFTTTVICNSIVQNSIRACNLGESQSRPVCAATCAQYAESEALLASNSETCTNPSGNIGDQIRADFTNCALPANSLYKPNCITGITNEPANCGYSESLIGLCSYCAAGGINSTDTCCYNSNAEKRCAGVSLPTVIPTTILPTPTGSPLPPPVAGGGSGGGHKGLSAGAIAGIVIGSLLGLALLLAALFLCLRTRRQRLNRKGSFLNQPTPPRTGPPASAMSQESQGTYGLLPGGRIARMSALEGAPSDSHLHQKGLGTTVAATGLGAAAAGYAMRGASDQSSSVDYDESPRSDNAGILRPPPADIRREASLTQRPMLSDPHTPQSAAALSSAAAMSSPAGVTNQQSEELPFFKDYYSSDDIHPGDYVSVLWPYQPRASDEFALERGDMLKVIGLWDDGWATGVMLNENAADWDINNPDHDVLRDSGVSNTSGRRELLPLLNTEIKAFPLVCVCLPQHWRRIIESNSSTESTGSIRP